MIRYLAIALLTAAAVKATATEATRYEMDYGDTIRTYSMYIPSSAAMPAPLIVYAHGYSSRNRILPDLNLAAEKYGFAVCYPDGSPDTNDKDGWNVGYPSQCNMTVDEADFFIRLLDEVCGRFGLDREQVFCTGMSNGGDLCYQFMYTRPTLFKAYASVAGLTFENSYLGGKLTTAVPFMEIHGTADKTSMWEGDHLNTGGWGPYIPVPLAVSAIAANNRCTTETTDTVTAKAGSERLVTRTVYSGSPTGADVILYRIEGGGHSWANKDLETADIICRFFISCIGR